MATTSAAAQDLMRGIHHRETELKGSETNSVYKAGTQRSRKTNFLQGRNALSWTDQNSTALLDRLPLDVTAQRPKSVTIQGEGKIFRI